MHVRLITIVGAGMACCALAACGSDNATSTGTGVMAVRLTDAPFPSDSVRSVDVFVVRVDARQSDADSAAAAQGVSDDSAGTAGWITIAKPDVGIDLLALQNGISKALGDTALAAGSYSGFRLVIDPSKSSVTLSDGTVLTSSTSPNVTFPSASRSGIKVNLAQPIAVRANDTTTVLMDFNVANSFVMRGSSLGQNGLLFKPVITATTK